MKVAEINTTEFPALPFLLALNVVLLYSFTTGFGVYEIAVYATHSELLSATIGGLSGACLWIASCMWIANKIGDRFNEAQDPVLLPAHKDYWDSSADRLQEALLANVMKMPPEDLRRIAGGEFVTHSDATFAGIVATLMSRRRITGGNSFESNT